MNLDTPSQPVAPYPSVRDSRRINATLSEEDDSVNSESTTTLYSTIVRTKNLAGVSFGSLLRSSPSLPASSPVEHPNQQQQQPIHLSEPNNSQLNSSSTNIHSTQHSPHIPHLSSPSTPTSHGTLSEEREHEGARSISTNPT